MKIFEFEDEVVISFKKDEVRFSDVYKDTLGFHIRFTEALPVKFVVGLEKAFPGRGSQNWSPAAGYFQYRSRK